VQSWGAYFHSTIHQEKYIYNQNYNYIYNYIHTIIYNYIHTIIYIIIYIQLYIYNYIHTIIYIYIIIYIIKYITIYIIIYTYIHYNYIHTWFRVEHGVYNHGMPGYPRFTRSFTGGDFDHGFVPSKGGKILRVQSGRGAERMMRMPKFFENE